MALGLGGTAALYASSGTSGVTGTLTASSGSVIVVAVTINSSVGNRVTSITCTNVTFSGTARAVTSPIGNCLEMWTGVSTGAVSSAVTVNIGGTGATFLTIHVFEITGAATVNYFDTNGSLPATNTADADVTVSTSNANDFIIGCYREGSTGNPSAGSGFTRILGATGNGFTLTEYKIVAATQSSLAVARGSTGTNGGIGDAVIAAAAAAGTTQMHGWVAC